MKKGIDALEVFVIAVFAIALVVTVVVGNRVATVEGNEAVAETQMDKNGIVSVAVVMNDYEIEAADILDMALSVERMDTGLVASAAYGMMNEAVSTDETLSEEEKEWQDKLMAEVDDFLYVRAKADDGSEIVGKMYQGDRAVIKKAGETWTKIKSGNVVGYVKNEYCVTGSDALAYAKKNCDTVAKVTIDGLRIRKSANADAKIIKTVASGETLLVDTKAEEVEGWIAVVVDKKTCYVSEEYVNVALKTGKAVTLEEEAAAIKAAEEKKAAAQSASSNGQTSSAGTTQGASLAATADEETLLAALIQCEAGGQSLECMTAVGAVVVNRVHSGSFPNTLYGVIYQSGQFGPASSGKLESRLANGVSSSARQAARAALNGSDPTGGAKYFKLASSGHAGVVIGPIVFY